MTRPRLLFFTADKHWHGAGQAKVVLDCLLFATAKRRVAVDTLWAKIYDGNATHLLSDWFYKDGGTGTANTGGLNIGEDGQALYHHFYLPSTSALYPWKAGKYDLQVWAQPAGRRAPRLLWEVKGLQIPDKELPPGKGFAFSWEPETQEYVCQPEPKAFGP